MTSFILFGGIVQAIYGIALFLTSLFLILLVLIQRGRGGGLSGAFGGMGGQSAFGAKAGDTFTKVTIGAAAFWIVLCLFGVKYMGNQTVVSKFQDDAPVAAPGDPGFDSSTTDGANVDGAAEGAAAPAEVSTEEQVADTPSETPATLSGSSDDGS